MFVRPLLQAMESWAEPVNEINGNRFSPFQRRDSRGTLLGQKDGYIPAIFTHATHSLVCVEK